MNITIQGDAILNDGQQIGRIDGDVVRLSEKIGPTYKAEIKRITDNPRLTFEVGASPDAVANPPSDGGGQIPASGAQSPEPEQKGLGCKNDPEPAQHPALGTKDPAWREWKQRQK